MRTLIVPDVHERVWQLKALEDPISKADRVVMLGDFYDTFVKPGANVEAMCGFVRQALTNPKFTVLLGNHDCHYYFDNHAFKCSGYRPSTGAIVRTLLQDKEIERSRLWTKVGPYTVSHAGFHPLTQDFLKEDQDKLIGIAMKEDFHPVFAAGYGRGGSAPLGGPTWLDFHTEFEHVDGMPQIVGHSAGKEVRVQTAKDGAKDFCLDTSGKHYAWVDEESGEVWIETIKSEP